MAYYMRGIVNTCQQDGCTKDALYAVCGPHNDKFGEYCQKHAHNKVIELERYEQAHDYAKRKGLR